ncbi:MAG: signal peptide peptidase SppA [Mycobacteriaceae bacterium]|nr:signal peptide peptidase SppA [Mycobacteriaceae bacterium]
MFVFLPNLPGADGMRALASRVDTARHHGVPNGCVLDLDLRSIPPETTGFDPLSFLGGGGRALALRDVVSAIHRAAADPRVAGLVARVQLHTAPPGPVQELRAAIAEFTATKPSLVWAETYPGTMSYYLASAFSEVWMQPSGSVGLIGFATNALFLRDALDKVGVQAQFVARGEYKSAANLFTQDRYTDAHREADTRLLESLRGQVWQAIAESRSIDPGTLDELADRAPLLRADALTSGLIDRIGFRDEITTRIAELVGSDEESTPRVSLGRYSRAAQVRLAFPAPQLSGRSVKPTVAVVNVHGPIVSGRGGPQFPLFGTASAGADTIAAALREAADDDAISAIVLRVDSPGGSVTASETIWRAVRQARERGKPVVAAMGAVAASGGYYISMAADTIVANPGTITGSIGVITGKLVARGLKDRLGVGSDAVRTNANADAWSINEPFTPQQQAKVEAEADQYYDDFVSRVAQDRNLSREAVHDVARGRVWTGADAVERGLVDELGGLRVAVRRAKILAGLAEDATVRLVSYPSSSLWEFVRPRASSQPAAASVPEAMAALVGRSLVGIIDQVEQTMTGASVLWLGSSRW